MVSGESGYYINMIKYCGNLGSQTPQPHRPGGQGTGHDPGQPSLLQRARLPLTRAAGKGDCPRSSPLPLQAKLSPLTA